MTIYLDVCCLNRPFDDPAQNRVRLEAEAVLSILEMADAGKLDLAGSDIIDDELSQMPDTERREKVELLLDATPGISPSPQPLSGARSNYSSGTFLHLMPCIWLRRKRRTRIIF